MALVALAAAGLAGGWIVQLLRLPTATWDERLVIGAGLGIGTLSLVVLGLGSAGLLSRPVALTLVAGLATAGLSWLTFDLRRLGYLKPRPPEGEKPAVTRPDPEVGRYEQHPDAAQRPIQECHWLWLAVCPFLAIALLAAALPPGVLWKEEAFGYDVLEYHLAVPKTFHTGGRIAFLPNNVYGNFPLNSEMLSLLMMTLRGGAIEASFMAKMVNVAFAGLFVAGSWLAGSSFSRRAGILAGVLAGTLPWTAYLAGIAYVETGMLAMGMCSLAAVLRAGGRPDSSHRWLLAAGLLAGLAAGFKYPAVPMIALPAAILSLAARIPWRQRLVGLVVFTAGAAVTFSPWMVRNVANTGNPVFPLAYTVFGASPGTWDDALEARWQHAHGQDGAAGADLPVATRLLGRTVGDFRMGALVIVLAALGALLRRDRWTTALVIMLVWQGTIWLTATHHYARFAVVMLLPLIILAARTLEDVRFPVVYWLVCALLTVGAGWNLYRLGTLYYGHTRIGGQPIHAYGRTDWFVQGEWPGTQHVGAINALGRGARVMLVGEARSFYIQIPCTCAVVFNHHPLADAVRRLPDAGAVLQWLRRRGITHVLAHWSEMERLRRTYGFYPQIDADLFARLVDAGMIDSVSFPEQPGQPPYATLYEVPRDE